MVYMSNEVEMGAKWGGFRAVMGGEALAKVTYTNTASEEGYVGVSPNLPMGVVVPIDLTDVGGGFNIKRGAWMASEPGVSASYKSLPAKSCTACCCGGMPPLIQTLRGEGKAFLNGGGTIAKKELASGETILVDSDAVFAFQDGVGYDVKTVGSCMTCCFGGEGCFNTELTGPGVIYVQTMSYDKLMKLLVTVRKEPKKAEGGGAPPGVDGVEMSR